MRTEVTRITGNVLLCLLTLFTDASAFAANEASPDAGVAPVTVASTPVPATKPSLPLELGRFEDELKRIDDRGATEPPESRKLQLCGVLETLTRLANDIAKAPLLEMTQQNFKSWQTATGVLRERVNAMEAVCRESDVLLFAVDEKYAAIKQQFVDLLRIRQ